MEEETKAFTAFKRNTADHIMHVLFDDESKLIRHLRFDREGSNIYHFNITTWPGYLCISGDMGCYVFRRLADMFRFFRGELGDINPSYWAEKLEATSRQQSVKEFVPNKFKEQVRDWFEQKQQDKADFETSAEYKKYKAEQKDVWKDIVDSVFSVLEDYGDNGEHHAREALSRFDGFEDFFEVDCTRYTFHYLWCLQAIVFAIQVYDQHKSEKRVAA